MDRPDHVKCIQITPGKSWCGSDIVGFSFVDVTHAALNGKEDGSNVACKDCVARIVAALRNGADEEAPTDG